MKVQAKIEKELSKAIDRKDNLKEHMTTENILMNYERIKVLEWILSITNKDLDET